jgi:carboxyl-terminal processing protease
MRRRLVPVLALLLACSAKGQSVAPPPVAAEPPPALAAQPAAQPAASSAKLDPREALLATTVLRLLEEDHLLRKRIDDSVSRTAFATYLDRLDGSKLFLLRSDRDALGRYAEKIDDELRSGSLELAHEGSRVFVARVEVVAKMVDDLLAQPMNHDDEEYVETDPKKVDPAATDDELRDRWREHLELEVIERMAQMESRLDKHKERELKGNAAAGSGSGVGSGSGSGKVVGGVHPGSGNDGPDGSGSGSDDDRALPLADIPPTSEGRETKARADLAKMYAGRFARLRHSDALDAASNLINAVTSSLDPHTDYLPPVDKANFDLQMTGTLEGIGASLREHDHYIEIVELVPGGAAWRQGGLTAGDLILAVQDPSKEPVDVVDMRLDDVVQMIRGPKGTVVRLRVQKADGHEATIAITRDVIVLEEAYARGAVLTKDGTKYGYIHLPAFYGGASGGRTASTDVKRLLDELARRKVAGVVIDIRSNGGGLLQDCVKLTGELIDKGPVVQVRDSDGHKDVLGDDDAGVDYGGPVVLMVDRFSASASEILAGALQDYHRAVIVGTGSTHGKGTVQTLIDLDRAVGRRENLGDLKLTVEQFFRVSGSSTQLEGVTPDIVLPDPEGYIDTGERKLEHAIAWSQIAPAPHDDWKVTWKLPSLVEKSAARVTKNPVFAKVATENQILRAEREDTRMPLQYAAYQARRKKLEAAIESATPDLKNAKPLLAVTPLDDSATAASAPGPGGKQNDRPARWRDELTRDPWIDESVAILGDMTTGK